MAIQSKYGFYEIRDTNDGFYRFYQTLKEAKESQKKNGGTIYRHVKRQIFEKLDDTDNKWKKALRR